MASLPRSVADPAHRIGNDSLGWLESPRELGVHSDCAVISGWVFSRRAAIERVFARVAGHEYELACGLARPDVAAAYPHDPSSMNSGFRGFVEFDEPPSFRRPIEVWAELSDRGRERLFEARPSLIGIGRRIVSKVVREYLRDVGEARLTGRAAFASSREQALRTFLGSTSRMRFSAGPEPLVTAVVVAWNRAELLLGCLRALRENLADLQLVIVDNGSTDRTPELLGRIDGATIVRNQENRGFIAGVNQGSKLAAGKYLLLVNSDAELLPDCIERLASVLDSDDSIGAVGGKLIWPDGRLQEAGSIIWSDGGCEGYGRGAEPVGAPYSFRRDVDFCSAALLLTRTNLFRELQEFDERYSPAYYEDADYCVRVWKSGSRVAYEPGAVATHLEFASSDGARAALRLQLERRALFAARHKDWLAAQCLPGADLLKARHHPWTKQAILLIDDILPDPSRGAGFPRSAALLDALGALGYAVTVYATGPSQPSDVVRQRFAWVEGLYGMGPEGLRSFLKDRAGYYAAALVSRPHNLRYLKAAAGRDLALLGIPVIYDAEAIFAVRDIGRARVEGKEISADLEARMIRDEVGLSSGCSAVLTVSEDDRAFFSDAGIQNVSILTHSLVPASSSNAEIHRDTVLFVGAFGAGGPNEDAAEFLVRSIAPSIRGRFASPPRIAIAGSGLSEFSRRFRNEPVEFICDPSTLEGEYSRARVFIAPTRFAAGIPLKILEAASHGVPVVCTPLLARQLGWRSGLELLTAETPEEFAEQVVRLFENEELWRKVGESVSAKAAEVCNPSEFRKVVVKSLVSVGVANHRGSPGHSEMTKGKSR